jgi:2-polyprenyl-6-methoxyphenol hydroxylase-like FAD-dependent oxidoreductase
MGPSNSLPSHLLFLLLPPESIAFMQYILEERHLSAVIVAWTMTRREVYHLQIADYHDRATLDGSGGWTQSVPYDDMETLRKRWSDFEPAIRHILAETETVSKWEICEVDLVWANEKGNVILMGDAAHAIAPYAGQVGDGGPPILLMNEFDNDM